MRVLQLRKLLGLARRLAASCRRLAAGRRLGSGTDAAASPPNPERLTMGSVGGGLQNDPYDDPVFRLNFIGTLAVQYDIAELCAVCFAPVLAGAVHNAQRPGHSVQRGRRSDRGTVRVPQVIACVFVARDGFFTLQGTGVLVRECETRLLAWRTAIQLTLKLAASVVARELLSRTMRATLHGRPTIHGVSRLAATVIKGRNLVGDVVGRAAHSAPRPVRSVRPGSSTDIAGHCVGANRS